jgi:hypothetical protein
MKTSDAEIYSDQDFYSEDLTVDLPRRLERLTSSHRSFSVRAAQELYRAERYRQYLSLVIVRGDLLDTSGPNGAQNNIAGSLADLAKLVRYDCRTSDLVSGVEHRIFAVLLVETGPEGVAEFLTRLEKAVALFFPDGKDTSADIPFPVEVVTFPDQGDNTVSLGESLEIFYRRSKVRS